MLKAALTLVFLLILGGCASNFPKPNELPVQGEAELNATELFNKSFVAHGGEHLDELRNVNVGIDGKWKKLIRRIQPLVTDFNYRVKSQERLLPQARVYAAHYQGPGGRKTVFRKPDEIKVWYNGKASQSPEVLSSSALTGDSFHLFLLGPLALEKWRDGFQRLSNIEYQNKTYYRLYLQRFPGFGYSERDEMVLWIDQTSFLTKMVQITLEGHETTKGAHVEVEYLDYLKRGNYTFPSQFFERVNAPIAIDAHGWQLTGLDINRDYSIEDISGVELRGNAADDAAAIEK